jgi:hypothetical protein
MKACCLIVLLSMAMTGCSSLENSSPWLLAPSQQDWEAAFSKLSPDEQQLIKANPMAFAVSASAQGGALFQPKYGPPGGKPIPAERLDMVGICDGFNRTLGTPAAKRWDIVEAISFEQIGAPDGIQNHYFDFHWTFRNAAGNAISISECGFGPGIDIKWFPARTAILAEANQAVALTFLKLVLDLEKR